jgi:hypothetical protein
MSILNILVLFAGGFIVGSIITFCLALWIHGGIDRVEHDRRAD